MQELLLTILAIELGLVLLGVVAVFGLDAYALILRGKESQRSGTLRILTQEEMLAHGLNPKDYLNPTPPVPGAVEAKAGQYL